MELSAPTLDYGKPKNCSDYFEEHLGELCQDIQFTRPIIFILVALIMDIIEPYLYAQLLQNKLIWKKGIFTIKQMDILFIYRVGKKLCLVMALVFMIMQSSIYGG